MSQTDLARFRRRCGQLRLVVTGIFVGLALLFLLVFLAGPIAGMIGQGWSEGQQRLLLLIVVRISPGACYLFALYSIRQALGDLAAGRLFQSTVAQAIRRVGWGVSIGATLSVFAVTNLTRIIMDGQGGFAHFDLSGIVLAVIGAALVLMAQVIEQAGRVQAELDEMI